jgi:Site-specific recombinase XerD
MRRPNGAGTIVKLPGNRRRPYAVKVCCLARPGLWKQKYIGYYEKGREAQDALDAYNSGSKPVDLTAVTFAHVYELWSARKYAKAGASSVASYKTSWAHLSPLATKPVDQITLDDLQTIIDNAEAAGMSKSSINNDKILMKALFTFALKHDWIVKDYSAFVEMPSVGAKHEKGIFDDIQMTTLAEMAADGFPWADTALILCYTGFRIGELLALTRFDYDADADCLRGGSKTEAGKDRLVPVHPKIRPYILRRIAEGGDRIICNRALPVKDAWYRKRCFAPIAEALGTPQATPHWCRHTFASRLHAAGADRLAIKRIMGHANGDVTEYYTHTDITFLTSELLKVV